MPQIPRVLAVQLDLVPEYIQLLTFSYLVYGISATYFWQAVATHVSRHSDRFSTDGLAAVLWAHARAAALAPKSSELAAGIRARQRTLGREDPEEQRRVAVEAASLAMYSAVSNVL